MLGFVHGRGGLDETVAADLCVVVLVSCYARAWTAWENEVYTSLSEAHRGVAVIVYSSLAQTRA